MLNLQNSILTVLLIFGNTFLLLCQVSLDDYNRADSTIRFNKLVYHSPISPKWIDSTHNLWYKVNTVKGSEYNLVNAKTLKKKNAFNQEKLAEKLTRLTGKKYNPYSLPLKKISFNKNLTEMTFVIDSTKWHCNLSNYNISNKKKIKSGRIEKYWGETEEEYNYNPVFSNDSLWYAFIRNYNVYIKDRETGNEFQLSFDGSEGDYYSAKIQWSPDNKYLATFKIRSNTKRFFYFVESSPKKQLQPILHKREYLKPGDAVIIRKPSLFNIKEKKQITVKVNNLENQYEISNLKWRKDSRGFTFEYNQRGHQVYKVIEINASDGKSKILIDEQSNTFIDYSGKKFRYDVKDGKEIIWASERDGWNHLYLFNGSTGEVKNQITSGEWVVRGVEYVDEDNRTIIFKGSGRNKNEDPYFIHYYRIHFDGSGLSDLTPESSNHHATFSADYKYFIDIYSKVDQPPVTVLRQSPYGKTIMQLENADISDLLATGWKPPEVFVAKGRDGITDIWGIVYRPTNFDSTRVYPIIEYIYAGPHSSFVPKSFQPYFYPFSGLAELGFVIVQIDGMGTSNRSKAFHNICYKNLKDAGFPDRKIWIKTLASKFEYLDTTRIGIFGGSAGGQNAMSALLFHPDFYKVAVSSCGCHDNRMDKIWWNEQWMGYPIGPHYEECSNVINAHKLQGKLMLIVGEMDDNVDPASTMQVVDALVKAEKDFELLVLPGTNHTLGGKYGERKRRDFFVKHLLHARPPDWNTIKK